MIKPRLDKLLEQTDSHYACVLVAAKRARQINSYYHNLGEGTFDEYPPPMVETGSKNYLKISLDEIAAGKIKYRYRASGRRGTWLGILLGVSGGIAAYKAVELVRLATAAGHAVRVIQTPASLNFVGGATFEGVTGAPVLVDEFERDPARGAFPGDPAPDHDPISHLELVRRCDVLCVAPASANTLAKLAGGLADNLLTSAALAVHRAARARAGDERPHVGAPRHAREPRDPAPARRGDRRARDRPARVEGRVGGGPAGGAAAEILAAIEAALGPRRASRRARSTGCACSSPPAARASRSTRCATWATARPGGWAWRWPRRRPGAAPR